MDFESLKAIERALKPARGDRERKKNKAQQANVATKSILITLSTPNTFRNINVGLPR